jgi:hypothetical protein
VASAGSVFDDASEPTLESVMADPIVTPRVLQVEHIKIETTKKFADVAAALETNVPQRAAAGCGIA